MARKKVEESNITAKASAKIEAIAKATYARKRHVTQIIPPDVTRAKAGRWLDLISPITEWAGLKGDALRYRRQQLRIQQESSLVRLAEMLSSKIAGREVRQPVPLKILVPALEKASLENPEDVYMIEKWADLLAASATQPNVPPHFVSILAELSGSQARLLEKIVLKREVVGSPDFAFNGVMLDLDDSILQELFQEMVRTEKSRRNAVYKGVKELMKNPGLFFLVYEERLIDRYREVSQSASARKHFSVQEETMLSLDVLQSLNLIEFRKFGYRTSDRVYKLQFYQVTDSGLSFLNVCSPKVRDLLAILRADKSGRYFPAESG